MISYGPFGDPVRAKIGLDHLISRKLGVTRSMNMGIVWQEGDECQFLQKCTPYASGYSEMVHVTVDHVRKPPPKVHQISDLGLAWNAINVVGDAGFAYMSITAFGAVIGVATAIISGATVSAGAIFMAAFTVVEAGDALAMFSADGIMTLLQSFDKATGGDLEETFRDTEFYQFVETWGPIIAIPAVGHDIYLAFNIPRDARLVAELRAKTLSRAKEVLREMRATGAFIGTEENKALDATYAALKKRFREEGEDVRKAAEDFRKLTHFGLPADVIGLINDAIHWHDIADGAMADLNEMDFWLGRGASYAGNTAGAWFDSADSWLAAGAARAASHMPRQMGSTYQAARFGGIHFSPPEAPMQVRSMLPITVHLIGGTQAKPLKGKR